MTEGWLCEGGHPFYLIDGAKVCFLCEEVARVGAKAAPCRAMGHVVPVTHKMCRVCEQYQKIPWRKALDLNGAGTCAKGHEVTHDSLIYSVRTGKGYERKCPHCVSEGSQVANAARRVKAIERATVPIKRDGWKQRWICERGHPKYRLYVGTGSRRVCLICQKVEKSVNPRTCRRGHTFPVEDRQCRLCLWYAQNPWLKELDENGISTCPSGHAVTHDTLCYKRRGQRRCPECHKKARGKAVTAMIEHNTGRPNANKGRRYGVKRTFADWVVVYRLIEGRLDEVYKMQRGFTVGPTPMEEWIAHNSMNPLEGAHRLAYSDQGELYFAREKGKANELASAFVSRWEKWGTYGRAHKWEPKTMWELIGEE